MTATLRRTGPAPAGTPRRRSIGDRPHVPVAYRDPQRAVPARMRAFVLWRDGNRCTLCGAGGPRVVLHADHVLAWARGGRTHPSNLVTLCGTCNTRKGSRDVLWARWEYKRRTGFAPAGPGPRRGPQPR